MLTPEMFNREVAYRASLAMLQHLQRAGRLDLEDISRVRRALIELYDPPIGQPNQALPLPAQEHGLHRTGYNPASW